MTSEAPTEYLRSEIGDSAGQELARTGLVEVRGRLRARMSPIPVERQATLAAILYIVGNEIEQVEVEASPRETR